MGKKQHNKILKQHFGWSSLYFLENVHQISNLFLVSEVRGSQQNASNFHKAGSYDRCKWSYFTSMAEKINGVTGGISITLLIGGYNCYNSILFR